MTSLCRVCRPLKGLKAIHMAWNKSLRPKINPFRAQCLSFRLNISLMNRLLIQSRQTRFYLNDTSVYRSVTPSVEIDISQIDWTWPIRIRNDLPEVVWLAAGDLKIPDGNNRLDSKPTKRQKTKNQNTLIRLINIFLLSLAQLNINIHNIYFCD